MYYTSWLFLGHTDIVSTLLDHKTTKFSEDGNGATPLHYAAQNNFPVSCSSNIDVESNKLIFLVDNKIINNETLFA